MSGRLSDPLTVQTQDGSSWWRRAQTPEGRGLYALADCTDRCPTLRTIRELAEFGLKGMSEPDGITRRIAPTQALRGDAGEAVQASVERAFPRVAEFLAAEGEFHDFLHHPYTTSHDRPETGSQR